MQKEYSRRVGEKLKETDLDALKLLMEHEEFDITWKIKHEMTTLMMAANECDEQTV